MSKYTKTMRDALAEMTEAFSTKQIKMAIGIASDKRYAGGNMSGAVAAIEKIKKGLSDHKQVAAVLKRQNEDMNCGCGKTPCETYGEKDELDESSKAKRDAMRAMGKRGVDPADIDEPKASKKDKESAGKNIVIQLRKAKDSRGNVDIEFQDGKKQKVDPKIIDAMLKAYDMIPKPNDKEKFTKLISKSYRDMLKTTKMVSKQLRMGEEVELEELTSAEKKLINQMYDKKGNLTPFGKKVMDHGKKEEVELEEAKSSTGYELYHKDFSSAMQHAYAFAKKKFGMEIDPEEIDNKVATGPAKPKTGKTNSYRLKAKGSKKGIQVQVYNTGKNYELNMYKEEVELDENKNLIKDYEKYMSQGNKKDANAIDYLMSMPKYKRMSKDQMAKIIGGHKRKGIFREEVELQELTSAEKKLIDLMYDKKGNLTPLGKKVMDHGKKEEVELDENKKADLAKKLAKASQASKKGKSKVTLKKAPWDKKEKLTNQRLIIDQILQKM